MTDEFVAAQLKMLREHCPEANEREAYLFDALLGAMSLLHGRDRGVWMNMRTGQPREGEINAWFKETYGFEIVWREPEPKKANRPSGARR